MLFYSVEPFEPSIQPRAEIMPGYLEITLSQLLAKNIDNPAVHHMLTELVQDSSSTFSNPLIAQDRNLVLQISLCQALPVLHVFPTNLTLISITTCIQPSRGSLPAYSRILDRFLTQTHSFLEINMG